MPRLNLNLDLPGAVSAGTYAAGALDFIFEALDAFSNARRNGGAPQHEVVLTAIAGASAGAQTGFIAAAVAGLDFPPASLATRPQLRGLNPFYRHWVEMNDLSSYLTPNDEPVLSLLDSTQVDKVVDSVLGFRGRGPTRRDWIADTLRLGIAVTNLRGMPTSYACLRGAGDLEYTRCADSVIYAITGAGGAASPRPQCAGEHVLPWPPAGAARAGAWLSDLGASAMASGAFPLVFAPRKLERPASDYSVPDLRAHPPPVTTYRWLGVDGGLFDNQPLDIGERIGKAGNAQGEESVLLTIGPPPPLAPEGPLGSAGIGLPGLALALLKAFDREARGRPQALLAGDDPGNYGQFLISPFRLDPTGIPGPRQDKALAGSGLGGFRGYFQWAYRDHDYLLGRANAQWALRDHFCLPINHSLFQHWTFRQILDFQVLNVSTNTWELPIIPLVCSLRNQAGNASTFPPWPDLPPDAKSRTADIQRRIFHLLSSFAIPGAPWLVRKLVRVLGWEAAICLGGPIAFLLTRWIDRQPKPPLS